MDPTTARPRASSVGPSCGWYANRDRDYPSLALTTTPGRNVLVDAYRVRVYPIFTPTTVVGFPAAAETSRPSDPVCVVTVGVNNNEGLSAWWYARQPLASPTEACDNATKALAAVIAHLPPR